MNKEQSTNITKKKNRKVLIIGLIVIVVIVTLAAVFIYVSGSKDRKLKETLHLAEQYLNELDYEKAVAAYEDAINIDQKCIDAYIGIADIYVAMSDEAESNSDYENAIKNCDSGLENLNRALNSELNDSETITAKIDEIILKKEELQKKLDNQLAEEQKKLEEEEKAKEEEEKKAKLLSNDSDLSSVQVGDTVYFGHKDSFSLSWTVLEVQNDRVLLLADGITKCESKNREKNMLLDVYFYDKELEKILVSKVEDTTNNIPKGFNGEIEIERVNIYKLDGKVHGYTTNKSNDSTLYSTDTYINSIKLTDSDVNREEVNLFFLSYDEAKKYNVCDCILRNKVCTVSETWVIPYDDNYKKELETKGLEYESQYGYHTYSGTLDSYAYVDSEGNLTISENDCVLRPAMWVKID